MLNVRKIASREKGFTLVEVLIVIAIISILASLAGPSFADFINRTKQTSAISQLMSDLNRARSEAIKRNTPVVLCVRTNDTTCDDTTNWQNGWLVCVGSTACTTPISVHASLPNLLTLTSTVDMVQFRPNGTSGSGGVTITIDGTWSGAESKSINIGVTGSITRP